MSHRGPPPLALAEGWARELSRPTRRATVAGPESTSEAVILVAHGSRDLTVRAFGTWVAVALIVEFSPEARDVFLALPDSTQVRALRAIRAQLVQQPRTSFAIEPREAVSIAEVTRVVVEQVFRISSEDPSSFNRFADALQEVSAASAGAFFRLGAFIEGASKDRPGPRDPAPPEMYA